MSLPYDALLVVSFGGPEGRQEVLPFLENVLRGRNVPRERMLEVAEHYYHFDGVSPINAQNRALIKALQDELASHQLDLPIYWGNRNWHPLLPDALRQMRRDGVRRSLAFVTSAFSSYSGCRQYREDIERARQEIGDGAPHVDKLRTFFNHPRFISAMRDRVEAAVAALAAEPSHVHLVFTAHSIPMAMAERCAYTAQLEESCRLVAAAAGCPSWRLVYQSRSGPPSQPWLEPDVCDYLEQYAEQNAGSRVVLVPIGFISDHMEVLYDLDHEAKAAGERSGLQMIRAGTAGTHPEFVAMVRELIEERQMGQERRALGPMGASHDVCPMGCCLSGRPTHPTV